MKEGKFREDLYYRLNVIPIVCPPLRERGDDIECLPITSCARRRWSQAGKWMEIAPEALEALRLYAWPGNIRQLEWAMERAVVLGETDRVELRDLPPEILQPPRLRPPLAAGSATRRVSPAQAASNLSSPKARGKSTRKPRSWKPSNDRMEHHPRRATAGHDLPHPAISPGEIRNQAAVKPESS